MRQQTFAIGNFKRYHKAMRRKQFLGRNVHTLFVLSALTNLNLARQRLRCQVGMVYREYRK